MTLRPVLVFTAVLLPSYVLLILFFGQPLAVAFPLWRVPLLVQTGLIGLGRLVLGAHHVSDVWFSLWLGCLYVCVWATATAG